jgi:deoxyribodipyrimidine photolyase-related protein
MARFAEALRGEGHRVLHLTLDETSPGGDLAAMLRGLVARHRARRIEYQRPDEYRLLCQLRGLRIDGVDIQEADTEHFLLPFEEIPHHFRAGRHRRMEFFYREMRRRFAVLVDAGEPRGGRWNFDTENREPLSAEALAMVPAPLLFANPVQAILERLRRHGVEVFGEATDMLIWPVDRMQSLELLAHFCRHCLPAFGRYQDAMRSDGDAGWSLYHSRLSFALNVKLLHPMEVIDAALARFEDGSGDVSIAQVEGFVRQILGWREYVRGVYWANMPTYASENALDATRALPGFFWTGETRMACLRQPIDQSLRFAYAHHIQRLMLTGNFCLLAGIDPDAVDDWYLGVYIDALQWVEMPNTRGMSQFADGGIVATKPYAASGSYVRRMSNYCTGCAYEVRERATSRACPLNSLYWHFLERHRDLFGTHPRMRMAYRNWDRMASTERDATLKRAEWCLANLESL